MHIVCDYKPKSLCELHLTVPVAEHEQFLQSAAEKIGKHLKIDGFRSGHIPFDVVKKEIGDMRILETAAEEMIKKALLQAIKEHTLETVGPPKVNIKKLVPGNDVEADIELALLPHVTLPDIERLSITEKPAKIEGKEVDDALLELRHMRAREAATLEPATHTDRVVVDMVIAVENVPIEGGSTKNHSIILDEPSYIVGLTEQVVGVKKGDVKKFNLPFPENYYNKLLAGKTAQFEVRVQEVFRRTLPEADDAFAQGLQVENLAKLHELLERNLLFDTQHKNHESARAEMVDALINKTTFAEIPDILLDAEKERLLAELKTELERHGATLEQYLADIKKTPEQIAEGMADKALTRVKGSLMLREFAKKLNVAVTDEEFEKEIADVRSAYKDNPNINDRLKDENILEYIRMNFLHRKTTDKLAERIIKKESL